MFSWLVFISCLITSAVCYEEFVIQDYELPTNESRRSGTAVIDGSTLFLAGGRTFESTTVRTVYEIDLDATDPEWQWASDISESVVVQPWFTAGRGFIQFDDRIYLACHDNKDGKIYEFDTTDASFSELDSSPLYSKEDCCATGVTTADGEERIYIIGGIGSANYNPSDQVVYYSIDNDSWTNASSLNVGRSHEACTTYGDQIYVFGGANRTAAETFTSAEIYDVEDDLWVLVEDVVVPGRSSFAALSVEQLDSIILVAGDAHASNDPDGPLPLDLVEVFDVNTTTIRTDLDVAQLNYPRYSPTTILRETLVGDITQYDVIVISGQETDDATNSVRLDTEIWTFQEFSDNTSTPTSSPSYEPTHEPTYEPTTDSPTESVDGSFDHFSHRSILLLIMLPVVIVLH